MPGKWIVAHIGCIECGVGSGIVGVFTDMQKAQTVAEECQTKHGWMGGGQNEFEVFEMPEDNLIHPDYE